MRSVARFAAFAIGLIGAIDAFILNVLVSLYHSVLRLTGADPNTHGWIGLGLVLLAVVGAILVLFMPRVGGVLLLIAGVGLFFVIHFWALLASPQLIIGGLIPFLAGAGEEPRAREHGPASGRLAAE